MIPKYRAWFPMIKEVLPVDKIDFHHGHAIVHARTGFEKGGWYEEVSEDAGRMTSIGNGPQFPRVILLPYTGIEDINGKEVAAGDVVNIHIFTMGVDPDSLGAFEDEHEFKNVEVKYGKAFDIDYDVESFYIEDGEEILLLAELPLHEESFEIIGNIYENPELLEK